MRGSWDLHDRCKYWDGAQLPGPWSLDKLPLGTDSREMQMLPALCTDFLAALIGDGYEQATCVTKTIITARMALDQLSDFRMACP